MYNDVGQTRLQEKIAKTISFYGVGILGFLMVLQQMLTIFIGEPSGRLEDLGMLLVWIVINFLFPAILFFSQAPYFLQGYYKLKYPEAYRKYEMKSVEEWYGEKYLKKHKELLENE